MSSDSNVDQPSCSFINTEANESEDGIIMKNEIKSNDDKFSEQPTNCSSEADCKADVEQISNESASQKDIDDGFRLQNMPDSYKETYEEYINKVKALASVPIDDIVTPEFLSNFKHFNLRYYEDKYSINFRNIESCYCDILIRIHTNKLFLISLAPGNDIVKCGKTISGINFVINNTDRSKVVLKGKKKRGAKIVEPHTILCQLKFEGIPKMYNVRAGVPGRIIEINELVIKNPDLLRTDPKGCGFLAVVAPKGHPSSYENTMNKMKLLSEEEYFKYIAERPSKYSEASLETLLKYTS